MADKKTAVLALLVVGIVILGLSVFADPIGLGGDNSTFGPRQIAGTVVGAGMIVAGLVLRSRP